jgi:hypothetical protein
MNIARSSAFGKLVNHAGEKSRGVQARNQYAPFASGWVSNVFTHRAMGLNCLPRILLNDYQALRTSWRS